MATREASIVSPSDMIAVTDSRVGLDSRPGVWNPGIAGSRGSHRMYPHTPAPIPGTKELTDPRHTGGQINMACVDGLVESVKRSDVLKPVDSWRRRWNTDNLPHRELWPDKR